MSRLEITFSNTVCNVDDTISEIQKQNSTNSINTWKNQILACNLPGVSRGTFFILIANTRIQHPRNHCLGETHTLAGYLTKRRKILLDSKRRLLPSPEEHKVFATHTTVWPPKLRTWTLFLIVTTTAQWVIWVFCLVFLRLTMYYSYQCHWYCHKCYR